MTTPLGINREVDGAGPPGPDASRLDALNPVTRLIAAAVLSVPILLTLDWVSAATMLLAELAACLLLGVSIARLARRMLPVAPLALIAALSMALYGQPGGRIWSHWWLITISDQSMLLAAAIGLRILALVAASTALFTGLDATRMADGLAQNLKLPARFVLGALAGTRMLGLFAEDWATLAQARRARGLGDHGRIRRWARMALALLVFAIRRGTVLATAMQARGFSTRQAAGRTWARPSRLHGVDALALAVCLLMGLGCLLAAHRAGTFWLVFTGLP